MLDPDSPYVAYCAPGTIDDARETLERGGHSYRELTEDAALDGGEYIILVDTTEIDIELPPFELPSFRRCWWEAAGMKRYLSAPLISQPPSSPQIITGSMN